MKCMIYKDIIEIVEIAGEFGYEYQVLLNGLPWHDLCQGSVYETKSGATYAILNEYSYDLEESEVD